MIKGALAVCKPVIKYAIEKGGEYCKSLPLPKTGFNRVIQCIQDRDNPILIMILIMDFNPETYEVDKVHYQNTMELTTENVDVLLTDLASKL